MPALDEGKVDLKRIRRSELSALDGLGRLLKVAYTLEEPITPQVRYNGGPVPDTMGDVERYRYYDGRKGRNVKTHSVLEDRVALRTPFLKQLSELELMTRGLGGYDDGLTRTLLPSAYKDTDADDVKLNSYDFRYSDGERLPVMNPALFDQVWREIQTAREEIERVPKKLADAWSDGQRSREYLNAQVDAITLTSQYYAHANAAPPS